MPDQILTSRPRAVDHSHRDVTEGELNLVAKGLALLFVAQFAKSGFRVIHEATRSYNCFANAFAGNHGWVTNPGFIIADDFEGVPPAEVRAGDVVVYLKDVLMTHCGVVSEVSGETITRVTGKWGEAPEIEHLLREVPPEYGEPSIFLRRVRPTTAQFASEGESATAEDEGEAAASAPAALEDLIDDDVLSARMMLASSSEVRESIFRQQVAKLAGGGAGSAPPSVQPPAEGVEIEDEAPPAAPSAVPQGDIDRLLQELVADQAVRFEPMLASTPTVARRIIAAGAQVSQLLSRTQGANNGPARAAVGAAALRLFEGLQPQPNDWLDRILLLILSRCPVREAAPPLSNFLLTRQPVGLARTLALEAFAAAVIS